MKQNIKQTASFDGTKIAYADVGEGPPLVKTATYITHLEHDWDNPVWKPFLKALSRYNRLIRYDERGCGLSDWYTKNYSWDTWVEDLKAVVDAEKLHQFYLFGQSQGSTVAVAFAARYPERVKKLIIFGGYARGWLHRNLSEKEKREEQLLIDMMKLGWCKDNPAFRHFFCAQIMPGASTASMEAFNDLMKICTEPDIAAQLERHMHLSNVEELAPKVKCPTLVLHAFDDASVPFKEGRRLADLIPDARFVRLDSNNHILQNNEPAWSNFWEEVYQFLEVKSGFLDEFVSRPRKGDRILRTMLFTDIIESTQIALRLGDEKWIEMLEKHNEVTRKLVKDLHGEVIKNTGDGFLATFESPSSALACAKNLVTEFKDTLINLRCGVHTGEIESIGNDIHGINIHIAARTMTEAGINEIWTTPVVKALTHGSQVKFENMGEYDLKGIPDKKVLYKHI